MQVKAKLGLAVVLSTAILHVAGTELLSDNQTAQSRVVAMVSAAPPAQIVATVNALLGRKITLGKLTIYRSVQEKTRAGIAGGTDCDYDDWRRRREDVVDAGRGCPLLTEALKIGSNTVIRSVDRSCMTQVDVIKGRSNPLALEVDSEQFTILDFDLGQKTRVAQLPTATFFVVSNQPPTPNRAKRVLARLTEITGYRTVTVILRSDEWFASSCYAPPRFWFGQGSSPTPTKAEYVKSAESVCVSLPPFPVRCYGRNIE